MTTNPVSPKRIIGAHVSTQGGFARAPERGKTIGVNGLQIFGASPVRWQAIIPTKKDRDAFQTACKENDIHAVFLHAPYLINLCSPKETLRAASKKLLQRHAEIAVALGAQGVIFHIGSRGDMDKNESIDIVVRAIQDVLMAVPGGVLIMENNAGAGNLVGDSIDELAAIYHGVDNDKRCGICIDTAHAFASGMVSSYETKNINVFVQEFESKIGIGTIRALHVNDSKVAAGTKKDRHENIGEGYIGKDGIERFINHQKLKQIPILLEVPGFDGNGPDKKNVDIIKQLIAHN